jgi:hypothetical protein
MASVPTAQAWGRFGHRASAKLTATLLSPEAQAALRDILDPGESIADASTWADEHSRDIPGSASWHYVNVPISARSYDPRDCRGGNCVVAKIEEFRQVLLNPNAPRARRRMALRYLIHLVQDLHQPLHVGDDNNRGGNGLQVQFNRNDRTNLHQVWDSGLFRRLYRNEDQLARTLIALAERPEAEKWNSGDAEDWASESLEAARAAYRLPGNGPRIRAGERLGLEYEEANRPVAERRLAQAGIRLARLLNGIFQP